MDFVFPRLSVPNSPRSVTRATSPAPTPVRPHVSFDNEVRVQHVSADYVVTMHETTTLLPEGPSVILDERTALLPPPVTARARFRMAQARQLREQQIPALRVPAAVTGAAVGGLVTTVYWTVTSLANGGTSPIGAPAVLAVLAGGAAFGGFIGLFVSLQDSADLAFSRAELYDV